MILFLNEMIDQVVIGTIGPGASDYAKEWCANDLRDKHYKLWHFSLNHYREIYGYTRAVDTKNAQIGLFPVVNC
tara:strand:+ start:8 stop:229 length:222 start_codon:yes stop_codon:yes gene_type:complete